MFGTLGFWEILLIFIVIALLFGGKKLPELGKGLGEGIRNFKRSITKEKDIKKEDEGNKESTNEKDN